MVAPYCWQCAVTPEMERSKNRAVVMGVWCTGETMPLCGIHKAMCKRAGGVVWPIPDQFEHGNVGVDRMLEQQRAATLARYDPMLEMLMRKAVRDEMPYVIEQLILDGVRARAGPRALEEETGADRALVDTRELVPLEEPTNEVIVRDASDSKRRRSERR